MNGILRALLMIFLIVMAIVCYQIGFATGTYVVVALGVVLEIAFWIGVFKKPKKAAN